MTRGSLFRALIGIGVSLVTLYVIVRGVDLARVASILSTASVGWVVLMLACVMIDLSFRAIRWQRLELAFWLLLAFSAGLAVVLVAVGLGVVYAQKFTLSRWKTVGSKWLVRLLPIVSAAVVTALGLWLCYDSVHGAPH